MVSVSGIPSKRSALNCIATAKPGVFFHYTSLETLWKILQNDSLRATQARFSNDSEEIQMGIQIIKTVCKKLNNANEAKVLREYTNSLLKGDKANIDCYIACFCGQEDILSQWRGYCRYDGVSIGFDFDLIQPKYYLLGIPENEQFAHDVQLYPVWYVKDPQVNIAVSNKSTISKNTLIKTIRSKLNDINKLSDPQISKAVIDSTIPLIKHAGFCEENEYRLLILNSQVEQGGKVQFPLDPYIGYSAADGMQRPYITIKFGNPVSAQKAKKDKIITLRLYNFGDAEEHELKCLLGDQLNCVGKVDYQFQRVENPSDKRRQIIIEHLESELQQELFEKIDRILIADACQQSNKLFSNVKLWCEGHLPIRSICVSPCQNQQEVIESIRHYCSHQQYWLKYVDVIGSKTPYRRPK